MEEKISLGKAIKIERIKNDLSSTDLAKKLGISRQFLCDIENDRRTPGLKTLSKIDTEFPTLDVFKKYKETIQ